MGIAQTSANSILRIIEQLLLLKDEIKKQIFLVFPFTYNASDKLIAKINTSLNGAGLDYKILTMFLSDVEVAALRVSTDIMINLPSSDQMTAAMLETLYAGGVVITGNWLPYKMLDEKRISYIKIDEYFELVEIVQDITLTIKSGTSSVEKSHNRESISHMFRWEHCIEGWLSLLPT